MHNTSDSLYVQSCTCFFLSCPSSFQVPEGGSRFLAAEMSIRVPYFIERWEMFIAHDGNRWNYPEFERLIPINPGHRAVVTLRDSGQQGRSLPRRKVWLPKVSTGAGKHNWFRVCCVQGLNRANKANRLYQARIHIKAGHVMRGAGPWVSDIV